MSAPKGRRATRVGAMTSQLGPPATTPNASKMAPPPQPLAPPQEFTPPPMPPTGAPREEDHRIVGELLPTEPESEELSPEEQVTFASLLTCGRRSKVITVLDHTVVVQTLCGDDDLRIGLYAKPYAGSLGEQRAYQIAVAAAGIRSIDGRPLGLLGLRGRRQRRALR